MGTLKKMLFAALAAMSLIGIIDAQEKKVDKGAIALVYDRAQDETTLSADADPVAAMIDTGERFLADNLEKSEDTKAYTDANIFVAWKGYIKINADGAYTFSVIDGAEKSCNTMVRIAGKEIINLVKNKETKGRRNRGNAYMASNSVQLQAGYYEIMIVGAFSNFSYAKRINPACIKVTLMKKGNPLAKQEITPASLLHEK